MENNVVTLETAKKLKAAGWEVISPCEYATWKYLDGSENTVLLLPGDKSDHHGRYYNFTAAPTAQEIADQLPDYAKVFRRNEREKPRWGAGAVSFSGGLPEYHNGHVWYYADTMAEALALLWLKLQEAKGSRP